MGVSTTRSGRCLWCGSEIDPTDLAGERRVRCRHCGAETTYPYPSEAELDEAYESWYRPDEGRFSGPGDVLLRRGRAQLASRLGRIAPDGIVLDVGSGDGTLIEAIRARGREAVGTERSPGEATKADAAPASGGPWGAVVFWHSLEHLPDPGAQIASLRETIAPGGTAVIAMPNRESFQSRLFGDRWLHLDLPRHLVHLPASSLLRTLRQDGFEIERVSYLRGGQVAFGWLHGLVGALPGGLNLYEAIRRPSARSRPLTAPARAATLLSAVVLLPVALVMTGVEVAARRGGTVYVEARRV